MKSRLDRFLDAIADEAIAWVKEYAKAAKKAKSPLPKTHPSKKEVILNAEFEDIPAKALPTRLEGRRTRSPPQQPEDEGKAD